MARPLYLIVAATLMAAVAPADSIRVGDIFYPDIYIGVSAEYYYLHFPDEGRLERVSRRRSDISTASISPDEEHRARLLAEYESNKAREETAAPEKAAPEKAAPNKVSSSTPKVASLDGEALKYRRQMKDLAIFETQLAHWRTLPLEIQEQIEAGLHATAESRAAARAAVHDYTVQQLEALGNQKATVESQLAEAESAREEALRRAQEENEADSYLQAYDESAALRGPYVRYYYDEFGNVHAVPVYRYERDSSLYDAALDEEAAARNRIAAAQNEYAARASHYSSELSSVQQAMTQRERDALSTLSKAHDEQRRYASFQARVATLFEADGENYEPRLMATTVAKWANSTDQRTHSFAVTQELWRLDCRMTGAGDPGKFSVTIYDADTDKPFTRIADPDFLGMRTRIFDEPGNYYLVVEQGEAQVPYEIKVEALALR